MVLRKMQNSRRCHKKDGDLRRARVLNFTLKALFPLERNNGRREKSVCTPVLLSLSCRSDF